MGGWLVFDVIEDDEGSVRKILLLRAGGRERKRGCLRMYYVMKYVSIYYPL